MKHWRSMLLCQTALKKETSAVYNLNFLERCKDTDLIWEDNTYAILETKSKPRQIGMQQFLESLNCDFFCKIMPKLNIWYEQTHAEVFQVERWFDKEKHHINPSPWKTARQSISQCLYFSYEGTLAKEIKTQGTTIATAQKRRLNLFL